MAADTTWEDTFAVLFRGNIDRYGTEDGGSVPSAQVGDESVWRLHLEGSIDPVGVYPIDPDTGMCRWGCVDFDEGEDDSLRHAFRLQYYLSMARITSWVERSRSKGYHVWVFADTWMPPEVMRNALLYACEFVGAPCKEINPKQATLQGEQIGNYVRLPYPNAIIVEAHGQNLTHRVMMDLTGDEPVPISLDEVLQEAYAKRTNRGMLGQLAACYKPPTPIKHNTYVPSGDVDDELLGRLTRLARRLYEDGGKYTDRSAALCYLAGQIARDNTHDEGECKAILVEADHRWGKYADRADQDQRLDEIIERAYSDNESFY